MTGKEFLLKGDLYMKKGLSAEVTLERLRMDLYMESNDFAEKSK